MSGPILLANYSNQLSIQSRDIVLIDCDQSAYPGNIAATDVFATAEQRNATAVLWYSQEADRCDLQEYRGSYGWIYTMTSIYHTQRMLDKIDDWSGNGSDSVYATIGQLDSAQLAANGTDSGDDGSGSSGGSDSDQAQTQNPLDPSPGTAVAMVILYSITGIITVLFLFIIITGALRAHRHPERYGPRNVLGRARQSRARGIARAMLDTIPIVKFGDHEQPKPADVELAQTGSAPSDPLEARQPGTIEHTELRSSSEHGQPTVVGSDKQGPSVTEVGISAAAQDHNRGTDDPDNQGCSICTDDFEIGQDQRVLPCDHRFHPACIDPWLLNVSGTCPLCRIDLRPQRSRDSASQEEEFDEHGNPIPRDSEQGSSLPPPLGAVDSSDSHRVSVRRSIMLGLMGGIRPDRLTREERMLALREYRGQQAAARRRQSQTAQQQQEQSALAEPVSDPRLRDRLRSAFRIRTSRTSRRGQEEGGEGEREE